ncbi:MAG: cell division protein FtsZ [Gammaproteobacteria bacterium]|nr:cell division protein FtsZ [Gammaproteobacteria bacterium]
MSFELIDTKEQQADIKVVGVGGCGNNAIEYMIKNKVSGVDFICVNTDSQDLRNNPVSENRKCNIGQNITRGLGAGANPDIGRQAAIEDRDKLKEAIENCDMLFITAGMGGGTGTGASPVIAELAKELGILTVAVVTKPWKYEKKKRMKNAEIGIEELRSKVDSLIIIPNDKLCADKDMPLSESKNQSNAVLERAVGGIAELITKPGEINLDFADVKSVMSNAGSTMMGSGIGAGADRAEDAIQQAIASPLLEDVDVKDAKGLLINITSNGSLTNGEFEAIGEHIGSLVDEDEADVIVGTTVDETLEDKVKVTVVATGMNNSQGKIEKNLENKIDIVLQNNLINKENETLSVKEDKEEVNKEIILDNVNEIINEGEKIDEDLPNYAKQDQYLSSENTEKKEENFIKTNNKIEHKKDSNGELDLDYLDIPAFLRRQAD